MIVTDDESIAKRARHLTTQAKSDPFEYDHDEIGYNYRLTNIQAAMGVAQMERLDEFMSIKRKNYGVYKELFSNIEEVEILGEKDWAKSNFWFYTIKVAKKHKKLLMDYLLGKDIQVRPVWKLIHTLSMYKGCQTYEIENAIEAHETCINLPCSVSLKQEDIEWIVKNIKDFLCLSRGNKCGN